MQQEIKKAKIITIGKVENSIATNWHFDCTGTEPAGLTFFTDGPNPLLAGYTIEELKEICDNHQQEIL